jgi:hypothetical protein
VRDTLVRALNDRVAVVAIGPVTAAAFERAGVPIATMPREPHTGVGAAMVVLAGVPPPLPRLGLLLVLGGFTPAGASAWRSRSFAGPGSATRSGGTAAACGRRVRQRSSPRMMSTRLARSAAM